MLCEGDGVARNSQEGLKWLNSASAKGYQKAKDYLAQQEEAEKKVQAMIREIETKGLIETVRNTMFYSNYPSDVGYLPVGQQLERFLQDGKWSTEDNKQLEDAFGTLAVFQGIGRYDGRRARITVKFGLAKKNLTDAIKAESLVLVSIYENNK